MATVIIVGTSTLAFEREQVSLSIEIARDRHKVVQLAGVAMPESQKCLCGLVWLK